MGAIACALARAGWQVKGSDEAIYPPMSNHLTQSGISVYEGYSTDNLSAQCDLFVIGKRIPDDNVELSSLLETGQPFCSFPVLLREWFLNRSRNAVVAGGIGKTTTTAMLTWIIEHASLQPDYFIGGDALNLSHPCRLQGSNFTVIEGDEYASCFDDLSPKFIYYRPEVAIITNVLEDHPDLYPDLTAVRGAFERLTALLPKNGLLVLPADYEQAGLLGRQAPCPSITVGFSSLANKKITDYHATPEHSTFVFGKTAFKLTQAGRMNALNAAMAAAAASQFGVTTQQSADALAEFKGVANRQQVEQLGDFTIITDKATHPVGVAALYESVRQRFPGQRLVAFIQPRATGGRQWVYQRDLPAVLATADQVLVVDSYEHQPSPGQTWPGGPFSVEQLYSDTRSLGTTVTRINPNNVEEDARASLQPGDVIVLTLPEQALQLKQAIKAATLTVT